MTSGITVVVPALPPREALRSRAYRSIQRQLLAPEAVIVKLDHDHEGAAVTRQRGLDEVKTEFVAFLDDDDELLPIHLATLAAYQAETTADVVYPWFYVEGGTDPFPDRALQPFSAALLRERQYVPITVLARTEVLRAAGGFRAVPDELGAQNEDWDLWKRVLDAGGTFAHLPVRTWRWYHHPGNTSGNPERWS